MTDDMDLNGMDRRNGSVETLQSYPQNLNLTGLLSSSLLQYHDCFSVQLECVYREQILTQCRQICSRPIRLGVSQASFFTAANIFEHRYTPFFGGF